jgi:hypothetical protein
MTSKFLPLPLAGEGRGEGKPLAGDVRPGEGRGEGKPLAGDVRPGEGRGEGKPLAAAFVIAVALVGACGNYSNEDLEFMNAVPAREDLSANMPRSNLLPANEAELSRDTHDVIRSFNGALDFLDAADAIRMFQPTTRVPNGRIWGPFDMRDHEGWQWRFRMSRDPAALEEMFKYWFEIEPTGAGEDGWLPFIDGWFIPTGGGARRGMGYFHIGTDKLRMGNYPLAPDADGNIFQDLKVMYSTAAFPISVHMTLVINPKNNPTSTLTILYHYEQQENGQAAMEFSGTDSSSGASLQITSHWLASGRGRAEALGQNGMGAMATWSECWDDSFRSVYDDNPFATPPVLTGDPALCPDISTL